MKSHDPSRRQWLTGLLRGGLLSLIAAVSAWLIQRPGSDRGVRCAEQLPCGRCGSLPGCRLPQAVAWKRR